MIIEIEIPKEFEKDYKGDAFKDFFSRVLCDIDRKGACGLYEEETAEMFIKAFDESKPAYDTDKVVEELEDKAIFYNSASAVDQVTRNAYLDAIEIVKAGMKNDD